MLLIIVSNILILCCQMVISSQHYDGFAFLPRNARTESATGIEPIVSSRNETAVFPKTTTHYNFKLFFRSEDIFDLAVENGPDGFGCFLGSQQQPYRSRFIEKGESLEQPFRNADYIHCYALQFPRRDVLIDVMNLEGMRSSIVVNTTRWFSSLPVPRHYSYITSIALVEEPEQRLTCRLDLGDGTYVYLNRQTPELTNISEAEAIGCSVEDDAPT